MCLLSQNCTDVRRCAWCERSCLDYDTVMVVYKANQMTIVKLFGHLQICVELYCHFSPQLSLSVKPGNGHSGLSSLEQAQHPLLLALQTMSRDIKKSMLSKRLVTACSCLCFFRNTLLQCCSTHQKRHFAVTTVTWVAVLVLLFIFDCALLMCLKLHLKKLFCVSKIAPISSLAVPPRSLVFCEVHLPFVAFGNILRI